MKKKYTVSDFQVPRDRFTLGGRMYRTKKKESGLTPVILCHGFMSAAPEMEPYAKALAKAGYCAFVFEFAGGSHGKLSTGETTDMSILTEVKDLEAMMAYVKSLDFIDYDKLIIGGGSQGGFVSGLTAAKHPEEVKKLILMYPALCIPDDCRSGKNFDMEYDPQNIPDIIEGKFMKMSGNLPREMVGVDAVDTISEYPGEILLMCGEKDPIVNYSYMTQLVAALLMKRGCSKVAGSGLEFFPLRDAEHGFKPHEQSWVISHMLGWLSGLREALTIDVDILGVENKAFGVHTITTIPFNAECSGDWFSGKNRPGSKDVQKRTSGKVRECKADYVMDGEDYTGTPCWVHVINRDTGEGWRPFVDTNSEALSFLKRSKRVTIAEGGPSGLVIHILADPTK